MLALPALPGPARPRIVRVKSASQDSWRTTHCFAPGARTDRFASPDLGFWFDEGIPYDPPYDHLQTAAIFDMCCNQSVVMSDNLASTRRPQPSPRSPAKLAGTRTHTHTHGSPHLMPRARPQQLPRRARSPCGSLSLTHGETELRPSSPVRKANQFLDPSPSPIGKTAAKAVLASSYVT